MQSTTMAHGRYCSSNCSKSYDTSGCLLEVRKHRRHRVHTDYSNPTSLIYCTRQYLHMVIEREMYFITRHEREVSCKKPSWPICTAPFPPIHPTFLPDSCPCVGQSDSRRPPNMRSRRNETGRPSHAVPCASRKPRPLATRCHEYTRSPHLQSRGKESSRTLSIAAEDAP